MLVGVIGHKGYDELPEMLRMLGSMPLRRIAAFPGSPLDEEALAGLVAAAGV